MKIVFLDADTIGSDIDLSGYDRLGSVTRYGFTQATEVPERVLDADVVITNKVPINEETIGSAKNLKLVCVTATGTNILDKEYLDKRSILWRNVAGYSTESVAQHTFALAFYLLENLAYYDKYVKDEKYVNDSLFTHFGTGFNELSGKTWGIIGLGAIGKRVAQIAQCFGCKVIYYSTTGKNNDSDFERVDFDTLLGTSDIVSIHAPLTHETEGLINKEALSKMKPTAILINVGRGQIVVEADLYEALDNDIIKGAGLDVLSVEPMAETNPLKNIKDSKKLMITPHIAWAAKESRVRLMKIIEGQIEEWMSKN